MLRHECAYPLRSRKGHGAPFPQAGQQLSIVHRASAEIRLGHLVASAEGFYVAKKGFGVHAPIMLAIANESRGNNISACWQLFGYARGMRKPRPSMKPSGAAFGATANSGSGGRSGDWRTRLNDLIEFRGTNPSAISLKAGLGRTFVKDALERRVPSIENFADLAKALDVSIDWLLYGTGQSPYSETKLIPVPLTKTRVVGQIAAGVWRERDAVEPDGPLAELPVVLMPPYDEMRQEAFRVLGSSVDRIAPHGSYAIGVRYIDLRREPRHGELAVIERRRNGIAEHTLKRICYEGGDIKLLPESNDPRFQEPVWLKSNAQDGEEVEATHLIIHVVVSVLP